MKRFLNKKTLVTGGASGIGKAICQRLVEEGADLVFIDRNIEAGKAFEQELSNQESSSFFIAADLTISEEVEKADFIKENSSKNSFFDETSAESEIQDLQEICQKETMLILDNLISSHAQKCSDLGLPMFMSVCIPPSKKYKK